jgi:Fic family protein
MTWNWEQPGWPELRYDSAALEPLEREFLLRSGEFIGAFKHVGPEDQDMLKIELISDEAVKTSAIEGEVLNRASVQSSLRGQFGLATDGRRIPPAERGIAEMMVDLYKSFSDPLSHATMSAWHFLHLVAEVVKGRRRHRCRSCQRRREEPHRVFRASVAAACCAR